MNVLLINAQRFARDDKRKKLPRWINQYIVDTHSNLSTDDAIARSKKWIRQLSQPFDHDQTGISLWTLQDIEDKQRKDREEEERAGVLVPTIAEPVPDMRNGNGDGDADMGYDDFDEDELAQATVDFEA